ncbi:hypothetical protein LP420_36265 [Massilia sp. B-10]|nr:hypothetical protein LP420_36265 [Massilia sp. B-10]
MPEREAAFRWLAPLFEENYVFLAPRGRSFDVRRPEQMKDKRITLIRGGAQAAALRRTRLRHHRRSPLDRRGAPLPDPRDGRCRLRRARDRAQLAAQPGRDRRFRHQRTGTQDRRLAGLARPTSAKPMPPCTSAR